MNSFQTKMNVSTQALGVLMVFVLIFPTALENVVLALLLVTYSISGSYAEKWRRIKASPLTPPTVLLFGLLIVGLIYTTASLDDALSFLNKYRKLLLIPIVISIFTQESWRRRAYYALLVAIGLGVLISFAMRLGWLLPGKPEQDWVPFKSRIAWGFFLAYGIYLMLHHSILARTIGSRMLWLVFAILSSFDMLYLNSGRTGHIVIVAMLTLVAFQYRSRVKRHWIGILLLSVAVVGMVILSSPAIKSRAGDMEVAAANQESSSIGLRLIFWQTSLRIISDHPLLGSGTGSYGREFPGHANEHSRLNAVNPHNEYLLIACQLGLVGLIALLWLLLTHFKYSFQLPHLYGVASQGLAIAMATGCLFNSLLLDHGEGHFYAILAGMFFSSYKSTEPEG
jgi:O-antigen ligase